MESGGGGVAMLTVAEVATSLRVTPQTVYALVAAGLLESIRIGRAVRVPQTALATFIANGGRTWPGGWRKRPRGEEHAA